MPYTIPQRIPIVDPLPLTPNPSALDPATFATYDVAIGGLGFRYATDEANSPPLTFETAPYAKDRVDSAAEPGEQTLTNWWLKSQSSFHGGAGNLNLERVDIPAQYTHIRFDSSQNIDPWTPGIVQRLPDTSVVSTETTNSMVGISVAGVDWVFYINSSGAVRACNTSTATTSTVTAVTDVAYSLSTDGSRLFVAAATHVWRVDPAALTATAIATYATTTTPVVGWVKSRLMLGYAGAVYEIDSTVSTPAAITVTSTDLRYNHPNPSWTWRCFSESNVAILAAGDAGSYSAIVEFTLTSSGTTPILTVADTGSILPPGERVLSMTAALGTYLSIGTTAGLRIGSFRDQYDNPFLSYGPLTVGGTGFDGTAYQVAASASRDRFIYVAGLSNTEPGLVCVDLGTQTDSAGRYAWATNLIAPTAASSTAPATAVCVLPASNKLLFSVPSIGLCLEGTGPGTARDAWLQTSRIRYNTTEPKLFKLGIVRGTLTAATIRIDQYVNAGLAGTATVGFTTGDPGEFSLPSGQQEWMALKFTLSGAGAQLTSYGVKALPGTPRQRVITVIVACADNETDREGHQDIDYGSARDRAEALYALDAAGDEVYFEEFGLNGPRQTLVVIQRTAYQQTATPTNTSDFGGLITVQMQTVS